MEEVIDIQTHDSYHRDNSTVQVRYTNEVNVISINQLSQCFQPFLNCIRLYTHLLLRYNLSGMLRPIFYLMYPRLFTTLLIIHLKLLAVHHVIAVRLRRQQVLASIPRLRAPVGMTPFSHLPLAQVRLLAGVSAEPRPLAAPAHGLEHRLGFLLLVLLGGFDGAIALHILAQDWGDGVGGAGTPLRGSIRVLAYMDNAGLGDITFLI